MLLESVARLFRRQQAPNIMLRRVPSFDRVPTRAARRPDGFCKSCGVELTGPDRLVCSSECRHDWRIRTQPDYAARFVLQRDLGVCQICGVDTIGTRREVRAFRNQAMTTRSPEDLARFLEAAISSGLLSQADLSLPVEQLFWSAAWDTRPWQVDHVVPVSEGGGCCGLDKLRTLCVPCHKYETDKLMRRRMARKRAGRRA